MKWADKKTTGKNEKERGSMRIGQYVQMMSPIVVQHYLTKWIYCSKLKPEQRKGVIGNDGKNF